MSIYTERLTDTYYGSVSIAGGKKAEKIRKDPTKHYPNKDEARELRKIMASTGLSEEEVRQDKKYRKMLSDAQDEGQKRKTDRATKWFRYMIKKACRQTELVPQHPETLKVLDELLQDAYNSPWSSRPWYAGRPNAKKVIELYSK